MVESLLYLYSICYTLIKCMHILNSHLNAEHMHLDSLIDYKLSTHQTRALADKARRDTLMCVSACVCVYWYRYLSVRLS